MKLKAILIACAVAIAIAGCGKKESGAPSSTSSASAARVDASSPLDKPFTLKDAEAVDVTALFSLLPARARPTYDAAEFDAKLGATVITNLRFVDHDAEDEIEIAGFSVDRAELYGVDMDAIDRVKAAENTAPDAPFEKIFEKVRFFGVKPTVSEDGVTPTTIGAMEFDSLRVRQGGVPDSDDEKSNTAHFFNAFDLAGLYFKDIDAAAEDEGATGAISFKAPDLRFVGMGGGKLGAIIANDAEYQIEQSAEARAALSQSLGGPAGAIFSGPLKGFVAPDNQRVTVKSFEWRSIDLSGLLAYGLKNEEPPLTAKDLINLGTIKALDAETFIGGKKAASVAEMTVSAMEFTWLAPSKIRSATKGAKYDFTAYMADSEEQAIATLKSHGLDNVEGAGSLDWDWDAAKGGAAFKTAFTTKNLADFAMDFDLAGLELKKINAAMEAGDNDAAFKIGAFKGFGASLTDKKLLDAIFDMAALQMGGTGAELRQSAPAMVRLTGAQAALLNPRIAEYVDAVANFIAQGGEIEISARPEAPVPFEAMAATTQTGPQNLPDLINLRVVHKSDQ